jgi:hypothetical protein
VLLPKAHWNSTGNNLFPSSFFISVHINSLTPFLSPLIPTVNEVILHPSDITFSNIAQSHAEVRNADTA